MNYITRSKAIFIVVFLVTLTLAGKIIYTNNTARMQTVNQKNLDDIDTKISNITIKNKTLKQTNAVGLVYENWLKIEKIATDYKLQLTSAQTGGYKGQLNAWHGVLQGNAFLVLSAIKIIQQTTPLFVYEYNLHNEKISVNFSILGRNI